MTLFFLRQEGEVIDAARALRDKLLAASPYKSDARGLNWLKDKYPEVFYLAAGHPVVDLRAAWVDAGKDVQAIPLGAALGAKTKPRDTGEPS